MRLTYRAFSFEPPAGWLETSQLQLGLDDDVVLAIGHEWRAPGEPGPAFAARLVEAMGERCDGLEILRANLTRSTVASAVALSLHVRFRAPAVPVGELEQRLAIVDTNDPRGLMLLSMLSQATLGDAEQRWADFLAGVKLRAEESHGADRLAHHAMSIARPAGASEAVVYGFLRPAPARGALGIVFEPLGRGGLRELVGRKRALLEQRKVEQLVSEPVEVAQRAAHRLRYRTRDEDGTPVEECLVIVDGAGVEGAATLVSSAGDGAEAVLEELLASVRIEERTDLGPRCARVRGASVRDVVLAGRSPAELHEELLRRGFAPRRVPVVAPTTRDGQRRFWCGDRTPTTSLLTIGDGGEWIYLHEDGGVVRVFPHGIASVASGARAPIARRSVLRAGARTLDLEAETCALGAGGLAPVMAQDAWEVIARGAPVVVPVEDRIGFGLGRTIVPASFDAVVPRIERLAPGHGAVARAGADGIRLAFGADGPSLAIDLGSHVLSVDAIGTAEGKDGLLAVLRSALRGERYRVFDDATGTDLTATVVRLPSFLVGETRDLPALYMEQAS